MAIYTTPRLAQAASKVPGGWPPANVLAQKQMFRRKVIFDLHRVLVDWTERFCEFAGKLYGVSLDASKIRFYCLGYDVGLAITPEQFNQAFWLFAGLGRGGYDSLKPMPYAVDTFKRVREAGIACEIWTYVPGATDYDRETLISTGTGAPQDATYELAVKLGFADERNVHRVVRFIKPDAKPQEMAKEHIPLIVEDNPVTAVAAGLSFGHAAILVPERYNEGLVSPGVLRLENREDLAEAITGFFAGLEAHGALLGERL